MINELKVKALGYLRKRRADVEDQLRRLNDEMQTLNLSIEFLSEGVCPACNGHKKTWVHHAQDDACLEPCRKCNGTGESTPS